MGRFMGKVPWSSSRDGLGAGIWRPWLSGISRSYYRGAPASEEAVTKKMKYHHA
jgi:hypothetical protein